MKKLKIGGLVAAVAILAFFNLSIDRSYVIGDISLASLSMINKAWAEHDEDGCYQTSECINGVEWCYDCWYSEYYGEIICDEYVC